MDSLWPLEIFINLFFQNLGNWLIVPMKILSFFGQEEFFTLVMPAIFWCADAGLGFRISTMLLLSNGINGIFKMTFRFPRPFWFDSRVVPLAVEKSFGFPSGHAQISSSVFGLVASRIKKPVVCMLIGLLIFLIGISRLYLGVHFTSDVISGWILGLVLLFLYNRYENRVINWFKNLSFSIQMIYGILFSLLFLLLMLLPVIIAPTWNLPHEWSANVSRVIQVDQLNPLDIKGAFTTAGTLLGVISGFILLRYRLGYFKKTNSWKILLLRYLVGVAGVVVLWFGLGQILPGTNDFPGYILRFLRYTLVGFWIAYLAPLLFKKLGLLVFSIQPVER